MSDEPRQSPSIPQRVIPYADVADRLATRAALSSVLFETAGARQFANNADRAAFEALWLGGYLDNEPELAFIACTGPSETLGYIVASTVDPARCDRFSALSYFAQIRDLTAETPAHLHINLTESARNTGLGTQLILALCDRLAERGCTGLHVIIGASARNVGFYTANRFEPRATIPWQERRLLFMVRELP